MFKYYFFIVIPISIVIKHRRPLDSSGDEGCLDEDDKIISDYSSGMELHDKDPLIFYREESVFILMLLNRIVAVPS